MAYSAELYWCALMFCWRVVALFIGGVSQFFI